MTDPDTAHTLRWMLPIFGRKRADGSFYYSDQAVKAFLPALAISLGFDPKQAPPALATMVGEFARKAGVTETDEKPAAEAKLRAFLAASPLEPELVFEVNRGMREEVAGYSPEELARDIADALGMVRPALISRDAPAPEGAVKAGPMARFALDPPKPTGPSPKGRRKKKR